LCISRCTPDLAEAVQTEGSDDEIPVNGLTPENLPADQVIRQLDRMLVTAQIGQLTGHAVSVLRGKDRDPPDLWQVQLAGPLGSTKTTIERHDNFLSADALARRQE
jgi:hypothetical protein